MTDTNPHAWATQAKCAGHDTDLWYPELDDHLSPVGAYTHAARICAECTVQNECLNEALTADDDAKGMWGGVKPRDINRMRDAIRTTRHKNS